MGSSDGDVIKDLEVKWQHFCKDHEKYYDCQEKEAKAREQFLANAQEIEKHNKLFETGEVSYAKDLYQFSDVPYEEALKFLCGTELPPSTRSLPTSTLTEKQASELFPEGPDSKDWSEFLLPVVAQKVNT